MPVDRVERRLTAILSADVAGYSRHMAEDEQSTVRTITAYRNEISGLVGDHRGRVVDATGDNALAEFPAALDAVECAVEIQRVLGARNAGLPARRRMEFRIGVHLGDVSVDGERIYGDGVNVAARLQGLAEPGGICVSGAVHEQVAAKLGLASVDLGEQAVKNIPRSLRVFRLLDEAPVSMGSGSAASSSRPSIVVLPFADMSPERDQEYFCDGMAEEIINALTRLEGLHVVARTSAFSFKGRDVDVREIGSKLGVRSVLEGSVRKAGDRLRVTAQLVDVADGYHLWSDRFDREQRDVFAIQDEISASIAEILKVKLGVGQTAPKVTRAKSQAAYHHYLQGLHHQGLDTRDAWERAIECFEEAIALDPDYAAPQAGIALACVRLASWDRLRAEEAEPKATATATRAVEIDDLLPEGHNALGAVLGQFAWDWRGAEREFRRAIELRPGDALFRHNLVLRYLMPTGRMREALVEQRRALELDPLSLTVNRGLGEALFYARRYDEAIAQLRHTLEMVPGHVILRALLATAYSSNDQSDEALRERKAIFLGIGREREARELEAAFDGGGEAGTLRWYIRRTLPRVDQGGAEGRAAGGGGGSGGAWWLVQLYARLGETDEAFRWLDEAARRRSGAVFNVKIDPWLDSLRSDPRYQEILERMNLAD
jgi:adenylate cyclase